MAFWLARERDGQQSDFIQRFDPRFWTVNFPRPMMASAYTKGADSLRVDLEFHHRDALAGLIWDSEDTLDHPLLAYDTDRDYSRTTLSFRWKSGGILPLDAVNGPTLTIEGVDASGNPRSWYVRLWNYATGSPSDALVELPFSNLAGGWDIAAAPDPVDPAQIDRMFISLVPPGYDPADSSLLSARKDGWAELSEITCEGDRPLLPIGDVMIPPHDTRMSTAYDDNYNQTPGRLLRNIRGLGYRDEILHYIGMSHFYRLKRQPDDSLLIDHPANFCTPAINWHKDFLAKCKEQGYGFILSYSYELLAEHCPPEWMQRAHDGAPALTGWVPPSALLTPVNSAANFHLRILAQRLAQLQADAGLPVKIQIGEPWWWVNSNFEPCIYDDATRAIFSSSTPDITDMRADLSQEQKDVLNLASVRLGWSTGSVRQEIKSIHGPDAQVCLLAFTPTILHPEMPDMPVLNLPYTWKHSEFDRLQLEDYDWLTSGAEALHRQGYEFMQTRLKYPLAQQDYLAGFVLNPEDAEAFWQLIDAGLDEAVARGVPRRFVWALPQVCRDGYTRLSSEPGGEEEEEEEEEEDDMQAFDDLIYPLALGRDASVSPEFSTAIVLTASGHERRNSQWSDARLRFDVGPGIRSENELGTLIRFFRARRGAARGFRLSDPFDFSSNGMTSTPGLLDQLIGTGNGLTATYQLSKSYGEIDDPQVRPITRPRGETIMVAVDGTQTNDWILEEGGKIVFLAAPPDGSEITAGFLFDVPVRFAEDRLDVTGANFAAGEAPSVPLIEIREAV